MRSFLTTWLAVAAMAICPFYCMAEACGDTSCAEQVPQTSCCPHCRGSEAPASGEREDPQTPCCTSDCLCKGALPVKARLELPRPVATDMLPLESHAVSLEGAPGDSRWNGLETPRSPAVGGRGLRIALCSFLC